MPIGLSTNVDKPPLGRAQAGARVSACLGFIDTMGRNPYHPVAAEDYPRLFDAEITPEGVVYFERLRAEWLSGADVPAGRLSHLRALHLAYAAARKSPDECRRWQAFVLLSGEDDGVGGDPCAGDEEARADLVRMGCLRENASHDPRLYKSHVLWRERALSDIRAFLEST